MTSVEPKHQSSKYCPLPADGIDLAALGCVYGAALNDLDDLAEIEAKFREKPHESSPKAPVLFIKPRNTFAPSGARVSLPAGSKTVRAIPAVGAVFGRPACRVSEAHALEYVSSFGAVCDLSVPTEDFFRPPLRETCFDRSLILGSAVETTAVSDMRAIQLITRVNGRPVQTHSLERTKRSLARLVSDISAFMTFRAGDMLLFGESLDAPLVAPGDDVSISISEIGTVEFSMRAHP